MHKFTILLIFIIFPLFTFSQSTEKVTYTTLDLKTTDTNTIEVSFKIYYYRNGRKASEGISRTVNFKPNNFGPIEFTIGTWKHYYKNGSIKELWSFDNNAIPNKKTQYFDKKDNLNYEIDWGAEPHKYIMYHNKITIYSTKYDVTNYYKNGQIKSKGKMYRKNPSAVPKFIGTWTYYHQDGKFNYTIDYKE